MFLIFSLNSCNSFSLFSEIVLYFSNSILVWLIISSYSVINPNLFDGGTSTINVFCDLVDPGTGLALQIATPLPGSFIMFGKDKKVNTSSLLGYYAEIKFVNDSTDKIELFSVGSAVAESSK